MILSFPLFFSSFRSICHLSALPVFLSQALHTLSLSFPYLEQKLICLSLSLLSFCLYLSLRLSLSLSLSLFLSLSLSLSLSCYLVLWFSRSFEIEVEITRDLIFETSVECRRLLRMGVVEILPGSSWRRISSLLEQVNCMTQPNVNFRHGRVTGTEGFRELSRSTHRAMIQLKSLCRKPG